MDIRAAIDRAIASSPTLRSKKDLIEEFVDKVTLDGVVAEEWRAYIQAKREAELARIIAEESLRPEETREFVERAFRDGRVPVTGTAITAIMPPTSRFARGANHSANKQAVIEKLTAFFERFFGLA